MEGGWAIIEMIEGARHNQVVECMLVIMAGPQLIDMKIRRG